MKRFALVLAVLVLFWADSVEACPLNLGFQQQAFGFAPTASCQVAPLAFGVQPVAVAPVVDLRIGARQRGHRGHRGHRGQRARQVNRLRIR